MADGRVLVTGAAGRIGSVLRAAWAGERPLRLLDIQDVGTLAAGEAVVQSDLSDLDAVRRAMKGVDVVVHLAAIPNEDTFGRLVKDNVLATFNVFEAARQSAVRRVVFASTNHVTGFYRCHQRIGPEDPVRPDSLYAATKVFGEALGRLYADKWGLEVICLRIGAFGTRPTSVYSLAMWLSERDAVQLFTKAVTARNIDFLIVYGLSRSRWSSWANPGAERLGYAPVDDAEDAADQELTREADRNDELLQGGEYASRDYWPES